MTARCNYYRQALDLVEKNPYSLAIDSINSLARYISARGVIAGNMAKVFLGTGKSRFGYRLVYHCDQTQ
jgi:hypothetical protein